MKIPRDVSMTVGDILIFELEEGTYYSGRCADWSQIGKRDREGLPSWINVYVTPTDIRLVGMAKDHTGIGAGPTICLRKGPIFEMSSDELLRGEDLQEKSLVGILEEGALSEDYKTAIPEVVRQLPTIIENYRPLE